jgi:hypothetical protein
MMPFSTSPISSGMPRCAQAFSTQLTSKPMRESRTERSFTRRSRTLPAGTSSNSQTATQPSEALAANGLMKYSGCSPEAVAPRLTCWIVFISGQCARTARSIPSLSVC